MTKKGNRKPKGEKTSKLYYVQRNFDYDSRPENALSGISIPDWKDMITKRFGDVINGGFVELMAFIFHDKDQKRDKDKKILLDANGAALIAPLHAHALVKFKEPQVPNAVMSAFGITLEQNCQIVDSPLGSSRYLTHMTDSAMNEGKHIYPIEDVFTYNCNYKEMLSAKFWGDAKDPDMVDGDLKKLATYTEAKMLAAAVGREVRNGNLTKKEAVKKFQDGAGYAWVRDFRRSFDDDLNAYIQDMVEHLTLHGRNLTLGYIMGNGGVGKSKLATALMHHLVGERFITSSPAGRGKTPDLFEGCTDHKGIILNEFDPLSIVYREFNMTCDKYNYSNSSSRNSNTHFIGNTMLATNSVSPTRWLKDLMLYTPGGKKYRSSSNPREIDFNESFVVSDYWQAYRRFTNHFVLLRDKTDNSLVNVHVFNLRESVRLDDGSIDNNFGTHVLVGTVPFKAEVQTAPEITKEVLVEIERLMNVDVSAAYDDITKIDDFLIENDIVDIVKDDMMTDFIKEVIDRCVWKLLPNDFVWVLFKKFRDANYPDAEKTNRTEFLGRLDLALDSDVWTWAKENAVTSNLRMDKDEPLITEYGLDKTYKNEAPSKWVNQSYGGDIPKKKREFLRETKYRGFVKN